MLNDKKGDFELGWEKLFEIIFVVMLFGALFWFVGSQGKGDLAQEQVIAKETCLLAASSPSGSALEIGHAKNIVIESKGSGIVVKNSKSSLGYLYPCYLKDAEFMNKDDKTYIGIK